MPFDFLLQSMSEECHAHAVCVVLSGTGADGSVGLVPVKRADGFLIAQKPTLFDGHIMFVAFNSLLARGSDH